MGIEKNSGKGEMVSKNKKDSPSIIKKSTRNDKLKGSLGSPLCCLAFVFSTD